jgi:hypothetical protein
MFENIDEDSIQNHPLSRTLLYANLIHSYTRARGTLPNLKMIPLQIACLDFIKGKGVACLDDMIGLVEQEESSYSNGDYRLKRQRLYRALYPLVKMSILKTEKIIRRNEKDEIEARQNFWLNKPPSFDKEIRGFMQWFSNKAAENATANVFASIEESQTPPTLAKTFLNAKMFPPEETVQTPVGTVKLKPKEVEP